MTRPFAVSELASYLVGTPAAKIVFIDAGGRTETTYAELYELVLEKGRELARLGVRPGDRVGLIGPNSLTWMAWDLALLSNGAVALVFADEHARQAPAELSERYCCRHFLAVDGDKTEIFSTERAGRDGPREGGDVLTLVFSSGTTGRMKGLTISRCGLEHILDQFIVAYKLTASDRYYSFLPFSYFQQRALYYAALAVGADIVVVSPTQFLQHFATERPTYSINPPVFYEAIHTHYRALQRLGREVPLPDLLGGNVRWMITAMAPIKREVLDFFWSQGVALYETYGVTETGIVAWNTLDDYKVGTVGKPASDGDIVLGHEGEVLIRRKLPLALGYFDVPVEDEREVFRPDGVVATGDIASIDSDGYLTLIGRIKNAIVTAQGKKFHPEQLEAVLEREFATHLPVVIGGAGICDNTLLLAPRATEASGAPLASAVASAVNRLNASLESYQRIRAAYAFGEPFSVANGCVTRNLKLDRRGIENIFLKKQLERQQYDLNAELSSAQPGGY